MQNEVGSPHDHGGGHGSDSGAKSENTNEASSHVSDFWKDTKNVSASNGCPSYLIEKVKEDSKIGIRNWYGKKAGSSDDFCSNSLSKLTDTPDAGELSKRLASHPMTSFGGKAESLSESCLSSVQDPERKKLLVAEHYSNSARLKVAAISSLENMAAIDSVLGKSALKDIDCSKSEMPNLAKSCEKLKGCQSRGGLEEQAKELQSIYPQYIALKKEVSKLNSSNALSAMSMGPAYVTNPAQMSAMKEQSDKSSENQKKILALEAMYPALTGKVFKSTLDTSKTNFQEALQSQLEKSREKIAEQFKDYQKGINCMNGKSGTCDQFDKTIKSAPPLDIQAFKRGEVLSVEDSHVQSYLGAVGCRQKIREVHKNQNEALKDLAVGTALTIGTMGLGSIAATAKLASSSAETAVQAAQFASRARMASNALLGVDLVSLGQGGKEAYEHCSKSLNQLSSAQPRDDSSKTEASCPSGDGGAALPSLSADYRSCVAQVLLTGVTNVVPLVPGVKALGSAEKGVLGAEKNLAREGAALEKSGSSELKGLASSHRDAETRLAEMVPGKRAQILENMVLSDVDRSSKIANQLGLAPDDPKVKELMKLHADAKYSKTLEGSTDELQTKITEGMEILHPGYKDLDGPARNALASDRVKVKGLVSEGILGQANSNVSLSSLEITPEQRIMNSFVEKMSQARDSSHKLHIAKSEIDNALASGNAGADDIARKAIEKLSEKSELSTIMSRPGDYNIKDLRVIASYAGNQELVSQTTRLHVREFLATKKLNWTEAEAASYLYKFEDRGGKELAPMTGKALEAANQRKQALIREYPQIESFVSRYEQKTVAAVPSKPKLSEPSVVPTNINTPSLQQKASTPLPKAPEVIAPTKVPDSANATLEAPKVQAPSTVPGSALPTSNSKPSLPENLTGISTQSKEYLSKLEGPRSLEYQVGDVRLARESSTEFSKEVAEHGLNTIKAKDPKFIEKIKEQPKVLDEVITLAAHAEDETLLKESLVSKMQQEVKSRRVQKEYAAAGNEMLALENMANEQEIRLEKAKRALTAEKNPKAIEVVQKDIQAAEQSLNVIKRKQYVLFDSYRDELSYISSAKKHGERAEQYIKQLNKR